jgi:hypothetical protein
MNLTSHEFERFRGVSGPLITPLRKVPWSDNLLLAIIRSRRGRGTLTLTFGAARCFTPFRTKAGGDRSARPHSP